MAKGDGSKGTGQPRGGAPLTVEQLLSEEVDQRSIAQLPFEQGLKLLEEVVASVESGALPLERAILSYERGAELLQHLRRLLSGAEEKLRVLSAGPAGADEGLPE